MRVISLCPSLTELVFDLGLGDSLVGRTKFCVHPAGHVDSVEKVGGTKNPRVARIIELAPDVVLMNEEENRREDADALRGAGVDVHASMPHDALETAGMVRAIAARLGAVARGASIAADIERRAAEAENHARHIRAARGAVRFAYLIWRRPWMAVSSDTFVSNMLTLAGGTNVFADAESRYPEISAAALRDAAPDVVLLSSEPFPFAAQHVDELVAETGLARERFRFVDGELLSWHGSRTPRGIEYAIAVIADTAAGRC